MVGKIKQGETLEYQVAAGTHSLRLKIDCKGSDEIDVHVGPGTVASFVCEPNGTGLGVPLDVARKTKPWIRLTEA
jgi:hypothetical protein